MRKISALTTKHLLLTLSALLLYPAATARAYIDLAPTLSNIAAQSQQIAVVEVVQYNRETHEVTLKEIRALKGDPSPDAFHHQIAPADGGSVSRPVLQWAVPGSRGILFSSRTSALVCVGTGWYQVRGTPGSLMKLAPDRPDLPLAYYGNISRLTNAIQALVTGKEAIITAVSYAGENEGASFDLALNRQSLPGVIRVQRLRVNANMPSVVAAVSENPGYVIGPGTADEEEIPALMEKLHAADPALRTEAAEDLRSLGRKASPAIEALTSLLSDSSPTVRFAAASALLCIDPKTSHPIEILSQALSSSDPAARRAAAQAAGFTGPAGSALVQPLAAILKDSDESLRVTALESLSMLGPIAADAAPAITLLLDNPDFCIDAADALGRIGSAAAPALPRLAQMLSSDHYEVRWAAVRAMAQIGTPAAHPAVDFMVAAMPKATEVEGYNMMIYFSLLGTVAQDAAPAIQSFVVKNPVLPFATLWAVNPEKYLPWQAPAGSGPFGGRGAGPGGPGGSGPGSINQLMFQAYVHELGPRLKPLAPTLAKKIIAGTAGDVPDWGYKILNADPEDSLAVLVPALSDKDLAIRERAAVALGHMASTAAPAKDKLQVAFAAATDEKEKRLLQWSLNEIQQE